MDKHIPLQREEVDAVAKSSQALTTAVNIKFGCNATFHGMNVTSRESGITTRSNFKPEERYSTQLPNGLKLSVWKNDLTRHKVDAVVNAANEMLSHAGGLALALSEAGGPSIQQESDKITQTYGYVRTGEAVVTSAGKLPCKRIIHAVGPRVRFNPSKSEIDWASKDLERTIKSILRRAEQEHLQSVAIPAVSSGIFNFPLPQCADVIVKTLNNYYPNGTNKVLEVHLVNNDDPTVSEMLRACKDHLSSPKTYSTVVKTSGRRSSDIPLKLNRVTFHVRKGHIEEQRTSIIVNSVGPSLILSSGAVSNAILKKAGRKIQEDINSYKFTGKCKMGGVLKTKGHQLSSPWVYHVLCPNKSDSNSRKILDDVILKCLQKAVASHCDSIAFPAIGTGNLGFTKDEVAQIMTQAVHNFSISHNGPPLDVCFVIYPSENDTFKAFEEQFATLQQTNPSFHRTAIMGHTESQPMEEDNESPSIRLQASSAEAVRAAQGWIRKVLDVLRFETVSFKIRNNYILHFGLEENKTLLSIQDQFHVGLQIFLRDGQAGITVSGQPSDITAAVLKIEALCCQMQKVHIGAQEADMLHSLVRWRCQDCPELEKPEITAALEKAFLNGSQEMNIDANITVSFKNMVVTTKQASKGCKIERICFFKDYALKTDRSGDSRVPGSYSDFRHVGLHIVKTEKVVNHTLKVLFELNRKRIPGRTTRLYQRIPAQFFQAVNIVGFQREFAPPNAQAYGQGIYFTGSVGSAMKLWDGMEEEQYIYIVEADVLTGCDTPGSPDFIIPPAQADRLTLYDSVTGGTDTFVLFNGLQALPLCIHICIRKEESHL